MIHDSFGETVIKYQYSSSTSNCPFSWLVKRVHIGVPAMVQWDWWYLGSGYLVLMFYILCILFFVIGQDLEMPNT